MIAFPQEQIQSPVQLAKDLATHYNRSIIPVDETKKTPLLGFLNKKGEPARLAWKPYQTKRATATLIDQWQERFSPMAWAMITGEISGLITLDFDGEAGYRTMKMLGIHPHRRTGSGGYQADFHYPGWPVKSVNHKTSAKQQWTQVYPGMDVRGDGGIALVAGRNKKGPYEWLRDPDDLDSLDILPTDLREMLGLLHAPVEQAKPEKKPKAQKVRPEYVPSDTPTPIANILLERHLAEIDMMGGRDIACFLLACQLRDNNYSQFEAENICTQFASRAPLTDQHGQLDPFTETEARTKVTSAYSYPKRDPWAQSQKKPERKDEIIIRHISPQISREEHAKLLQDACLAIKVAVRAHIERNDGSILVIVVPPGVGKSHVVGELVRDEVVASWMAQSHAMVESIEAIQDSYIMHVQPVSKENCPKWEAHQHAGPKRINTMSIHSKHTNSEGEKELCEAIQQRLYPLTTVFMQQYIKSGYPAMRDAIIVDEINTSDWLPETEISIGTLQDILYEIRSTECFEDLFIRALQGCITDCAQNDSPISGSAIFDQLNKNNQLINWLSILSFLYADPLLFMDSLALGDPDLEKKLEHKAPHLLPAIVKAFLFELVMWQKGTLANSRIRIGPRWRVGTSEYALFITEPWEFVPIKKEKDGPATLPPIVLLDATANEAIYAKMLGKPIRLLRIEVPCAPGTKHFAVRASKRYGIMSLTSYKPEALDRAIREIRYVLKHHIDPDGSLIASQQVGLITFKDCKENMANALHIPHCLTLHFGDLRGKNELKNCAVLLVVGTPQLPSHEIERQARSLAYDNPDPVTCDPEIRKTGKFSNPHVQQFASFLTNSELTQAAHRNRPVRFENRTVVSFCMGEIDFLPITEELIQFPYDVNRDGDNGSVIRDDVRIEKLERAYCELLKEGKKITISSLSERAKVRNQTAKEWLDENKQFLSQNRSELSYINYSMKARNDFEKSEQREVMFDVADLPHYQGIEKGAKVITTQGEGVVNRIVPILGVRIVVYLDQADARGIKMHTFSWKEVTPLAEVSRIDDGETA